MLTNINPPERAVFGETSSGTYQTVKYDKDATNLIPINPNDPNVLNNNKTLTDWQKGIEAIATLDGQKATAIAGMYNSMMFDITKVIQDYLRPLISEPWHATVKYNISSYVFDNATGTIYKSLVADNLGNALTDNTKWENTGANIQTYIKQIAQNATNITANIQAQKPIIFSYVNATTVSYTSGGFIFDDFTGSALLTAGTLNLATNGLNGLDTGTIAVNTWYYLFAIHNPTTNASGTIASLSPTTPVLPSGFTKKKRIKNGFLRITISQIQPFTHTQDSWISTNQIVIANQSNVINYTNSALPVVALKADLTTYFSTTVPGQSTMVTWGNLKPWTADVDALFDSANNGHDSAVSGYIYVSDGVVRATHPVTTGGIDSTRIVLKAISEL